MATHTHTERQQCVCVVRGSINNDEYFHVPHIVRPGETLSSSVAGYASRVGGKGANQAVAVVRAGGGSGEGKGKGDGDSSDVWFFGTIGQDGLWIREKMHKWGVNVQNGGLLVDPELTTGRAIIQVDKQGENAIVLFPGANFSGVHEVEGVEWPVGTTHVLLQNEVPLGATVGALRRAAASAGRIMAILNPSPMFSPAEIDGFPWELVDWLIVNEEECREIYRRVEEKGEAEEGTLEMKRLVALLGSSRRFGRRVNIICTLGAQGVLACVGGSEVMYLPAAELQGGAVDTTGAGDTFAGYFVRGLMEGGDIKRVLERCVQAAGMCCEKRGTIDSIPERKDVDNRLLLLPVLGQST